MVRSTHRNTDPLGRKKSNGKRTIGPPPSAVVWRKKGYQPSVVVAALLSVLLLPALVLFLLTLFVVFGIGTCCGGFVKLGREEIEEKKEVL
jgi:hypothetical protein